MNIEREWLATLALNLVDSYNYSTRRALDKIAKDFQINEQAIKATANALISETIRRKNIIDRLANYALDNTFKEKLHTIPSIKRLDSKLKNLLRILIYRLKFELHQPELVLNTAKTILEKKYSDFIELFTLWLELLIDLDVDKLIANLDDSIERLALQTWEPYFLVKRFLETYEDKAPKILEYFKQNSPVYIRINNLKDKTIAFKEFEEYHVSLEQDPYMTDVFKVSTSDVPMARLDGFKNGFFYIQSRSSAIISYLLNPQEGEVILDSCAAPGSKTTHISSLTHNNCLLTAMEVDKDRTEILKKTTERCGVRSITILNGDARDPPFEDGQKFDKILLDAPCSGSGTLSTKTYAKWRIKNSLIGKYSKLQNDLLSGISSFVKSGGILLYSTCSLFPEENEDIIKKFLENNPIFDPIELPLPEIGTKIAFKGKRLFPHEMDSEGFSIFLLKRQ